MFPERWLIRGRRGAALILTLMISIAVAAMAMGAIMLSSGAQLTTHFLSREAAYQAVADGGLQIIRDSINRGLFDSLLPANGYTTIASNQAVTDALGHVLPRVTRSLYVGRTGGRTGGAATAGQYGSNFASAVSVISDQYGAVEARRLLLTQESWAKFAVAINNWSGGAMYGCNEEVNGPFQSNTGLIIQTGCSAGQGTLFTGTVNVVGSITGKASGRFQRGYKEGAPAITWPTPARINLMRQYAQDGDAVGGDYDLTSSTLNSTIPGMRIEFVTIDLNGDGIIEWNEGFMRVWVAANTRDSVLAYATGRRWPTTAGGGAAPVADPNMVSRNCGAVAQLNGSGASIFRMASDVYNGTTGSAANKQSAVRTLLSSASRRCYLGGDPKLFTTTTNDSLTPDSTVTNTPVASNNFGWWKKRRLGVWSAVSAVRPGDGSYLIPLGGNSNFKGVIFVTGDVALSGKLAGRVSVFSTGNIIMADDLLYAHAPGTDCSATGDIFGAIATGDVIIEDNTLQTPFAVNSKVYGGFDDTNDANYNMFFLAAGNGTSTGNWYGEGVTPPWNAYTTHFPSYPEPGSANASWDASAISQMCGTATNGCVRVTGGLAQGRVDDATYYGSGYYGWAEAHTYDQCGAVNPPPYFPTTGRFIESRYYELDPVWLRSIGIASYFTNLRAQ